MGENEKHRENDACLYSHLVPYLLRPPSDCLYFQLLARYTSLRSFGTSIKGCIY